jgi:hypothetical protein
VAVGEHFEWTGLSLVFFSSPMGTSIRNRPTSKGGRCRSVDLALNSARRLAATSVVAQMRRLRNRRGGSLLLEGQDSVFGGGPLRGCRWSDLHMAQPAVSHGGCRTVDLPQTSPCSSWTRCGLSDPIAHSQSPDRTTIFLAAHSQRLSAVLQ